MKIKGITAMYFTGTDTTKRIALYIASGLAMSLDVPFAAVDFSNPAVREEEISFEEDEILIIATPVYAGRVPNLLLPYLKEKVKGNGGFVVPVVTFGNRSFDNALIELRDIMTANGFKAIVAGAFAAQHSFSQVLGAGRPDALDLYKADELAKLVEERMKQPSIIPVSVPGDPEAGYYQPRDRQGNPIDIRKVKPKTSDACVDCKICANVCPMGAIDFDDVTNVKGICIKCCACERKCPQGAKYFDDPGYIYHKEELEAMYGDVRAESVVF